MKIENIAYDNYDFPGCETCDYGSNYVDEFTIFYDNGDLDFFKVEKMYSHTISEADLMNLVGNFTNREELKNKVISIIKEVNLNKVEPAKLYINHRQVI